MGYRDNYQAWLRDFALPICMLASMALSIPLSFALV